MQVHAELADRAASRRRTRIRPRPGVGLVEIVEEVEPIGGTDNSGRSNQPAAYVRFVDTRSGDTTGSVPADAAAVVARPCRED